MKEEPVAPVTLVALVMAGTPCVMLRVTVWLSVSVALVAYTVITDDETVVGMPVIAPVPGFKDSPAGSAVELKLVGELVAAII